MNAEKSHQHVEAIVPAADAYAFHVGLIKHGRYVCVARLPKCWQCAVARWCDYQPKTPPPAQRA